MEWLRWFDLRKFSISSVYIGKPAGGQNDPRNLHNPGGREVVMELLHALNDYPPMRLTFNCYRVGNRLVVASVINSYDEPNSGVRIPVSLARELKNQHGEAVKELLNTLS
jgi:hypothetical protein